MRTKKAGLLTKLVVLALLIGLSLSLLTLASQIKDTQKQKADLEYQVAAQTQQNADLSNAVINSDDPALQKDIARSELGLVEPGEKVFHITD